MKKDLLAYLKALVEAPVNILFFVLDIAAVVAIVRLVVDDLQELFVVIVFLVIVHLGHYLIFKKQRSVISELENRIVQFEGRQPQLDLLVSDGQTSRSLRILVPRLQKQPDFDELAKRELQDLKTRFPKIAGGDMNPAFEGVAKTFLQQRKSEEQYLDECDRYIENYRLYCQASYRYDLLVARLRRLPFRIACKGRVPAEDIVILLHFPDELHLPSVKEGFEIERLLEEPPEPPARPKPMVSPFGDLMGINHRLTAASLLAPRIPETGKVNARGPFLDRNDNTTVRYEVKKLAHGFEISLDPVEFIVSDEAIGHIWEIEFSIHAGNLPESIQGSLFLEVQLNGAS